jgi:hypothetical protein
MSCAAKDELEQHLLDIRKLSAHLGFTSEERKAAARAEQFAIGLVKEHDAAGHDGEPCPAAGELGRRPPS